MYLCMYVCMYVSMCVYLSVRVRLGGLRNVSCVHNLPGVLLCVSPAHNPPPSAADGFSSGGRLRAGERVMVSQLGL